MSQATHDKKLVACIPIVLVNKDAKIKIGKINTPLDIEKTTLSKDTQTKNYKLVEKKKKIEARYSGQTLAEQSAKYFIFKYNEETRKMEIFPGDDWFIFKKDIQYNTMSLEEAEERLKAKTGYTDYIRNKGNVAKGKKEKVFKDEPVSTGGKISRLNDEDEDVLDTVRQNMFHKEEKSEEEREEDLDPELREIPSDLEQNFLDKKSTQIINFGIGENYEEIEESESSDSFFGKKDGDESDPDDLSSIVEGSQTSDKNYLGNKRKPDDKSASDKTKKHKSTTQMTEALDSLMAKHKRMTYEKIVKELIKLDFTTEEISAQLSIIISRGYSKFPQGGENYYFKSSDKY